MEWPLGFIAAIFIAQAGPTVTSSVPSKQIASVPFVGCPADGMSGPITATTGPPRSFPIPADAASRLAFYSVADGLGVLAPRSWHCYQVYGSDGAFLLVSPDPITAETIYAARRPKGFSGPVIALSFINGFTSGRDEVSPVINRVFPKHRAFVIEAARNMDQPIPRPKRPFPADKLHYLSDEVVEYTTAPHREGLGTVGFIRPSDIPITGVELLSKDAGDCCDLTSLAMRLAPSDASLATVIRQQVERAVSAP